MNTPTPSAPNVLPANVSAPILPTIAPHTVAEGQTLTFNILGFDADVPAQILTYALDPGAPAGVSLDPVGGLFRWTPTEIQGGVEYTMTVRVSDNGSPSYTASKSFTILVTESNAPPILASIANQTVKAHQLLTFTSVATDPDLPPQSLSFSLGPGAPVGAAVDPVTGVFTWIPTRAQSPSTNLLTMRVTDGGTPSLSATQTFTIFVLSSVQITNIQKVDATQLLLEWETDPGKSYYVEYKEDLNAGPVWQTLPGSQRTAVGPTQSLIVPVSPNGQRFFRIKILE